MKGSNLMAGDNGYAFLKLIGGQKINLRLERARALAMTAIAECREVHGQTGRGRRAMDWRRQLWPSTFGIA